MVFSNRKDDHLTNLWHFFDRCRKYGFSLNPKKSIFIVIKGNILGYVISKDGTIIGLNIMESIIVIIPPNH